MPQSGVASVAQELQRSLILGLKGPKGVFRDLRNYLAGQFVGATRDEALLDEVLKCLFCKLYLDTVPEYDNPEIDDDFGKATFYRGVFRAVRRDFPEIYGPDDELLLDPRSLRHVLDNLAFASLDSANEDVVGDAFEVFAGSESRQRSGQFFTPRNATDLLAEAVEPKLGERIIDPACGAGGFLASVVRFWRRAGHNSESVAEASRQLFGIEKDSYLARLARLHVSMLTRGHPSVVCGDSLSFRSVDESLEGQMPFERQYDVVLTNPPFGTKIVAATPDVLETFLLGRRWRYDKADARWKPTQALRNRVPPQVLFVERCLSLLRPGGRLGVVLPESLLSNKTYRFVVEYLLTESTVSAVVGMPEALFKTSGKGGTHTKTCLVVAVKGGSASGRREGSIFMAEARWCGKDSRARKIPKDDLPEIRDNLATFRSGGAFRPSRLGFAVVHGSVADNVLCPRYYDPELKAALDGMSDSHDLITVGDLIQQNVLAIRSGNEVGKLAYGTGDIPFVRTSDLSNWEIKASPKHRVSRNLYDSLKEKQDVRPGDVLMVKEGTYLIGTCAMVTDYDKEIIYQSHLYKIRVLKDQYGLNPQLLLAILASPIVQRQVRAKQFTQDIIDSLGERIRELVLPIPRAAARRAEVSEMVSEAIRKRMEARALSGQAVSRLEA